MRQMTTREHILFTIVLTLATYLICLGVVDLAKRYNLNMYATTQGCQIQSLVPLVCAEHPDAASHGCAKNDVIIYHILCKNGRKAVYKTAKDGSTWSWKK